MSKQDEQSENLDPLGIISTFNNDQPSQSDLYKDILEENTLDQINAEPN